MATLNVIFSQSVSTKDFSLPTHCGLPKSIFWRGGLKTSEKVARIVKKKGEPIFVNSLELIAKHCPKLQIQNTTIPKLEYSLAAPKEVKKA